MHQSILSKTVILATSIGLLVSAVTTTTGATIQLGATTASDGTSRTAAVIGAKNPTATSLEQRIVSDGAQQMNSKEASAYLSNKTQQWSNGGAFYQENGKLDFIWDGKTFYDYTWRAHSGGLVCIRNPDRFTTSCSLYFNYRQTVWTVVTEVFGESKDFFGGPDTLLEGNSLSNLEPWDPALSGR